MVRMVRFGVIFGLVFQSLLLMWCAAPVSRATTPAMECCVPEPEAVEESCCCEESGDSDRAPGIEWQSLRSTHERCCQCPLTVEDPRIPVYPARRPAMELSRVSGAVLAPAALSTPERIGFRIASVPALLHPPDFAGRLACERFCRWTI